MAVYDEYVKAQGGPEDEAGKKEEKAEDKA